MTNQLDDLTQYLCTSLQHYRITEYPWGYELINKYVSAIFHVYPVEGMVETTKARCKIGKKRMEQVVDAIRQEHSTRGETA